MLRTLSRNYRGLLNELTASVNALHIKSISIMSQDANPDAVATEEPRYKMSNVEGEFTSQELLQLMIDKDPRFFQMRNREMPDEFWDLRRKYFNKQRSLKARDKKKEAAQQFKSTVPPEERATTAANKKALKAEQKRRQEEALVNGPKVVVDCSLDIEPNAREVRSLGKQLMFCVAANKAAEKPVSLHFVGFTGKVEEFATKNMDGGNWIVHRDPRPAAEIFPKSDLIVLSPDAEQPLTEFDPTKVYVVGGIVDRTVQKHTTLNFAETTRIEARRLPLKEFLGKNIVLNVNSAVEALVAVYNGKSWEEAVMGVVPDRKKRKNPVGKSERRSGAKKQKAEEAGEQEQGDGGDEEEEEDVKEDGVDGAAAGGEEEQKVEEAKEEVGKQQEEVKL